MPATLIPFAGLAVSRWRNGAGRKADIASGSDWLVGFAWLDADAPFSDYAGHDRTITLIEGPGFALDFGSSHPQLIARKLYVPSAFDGGWAAQCRVLDGPCMVLNAMTARAAWTHSVTVQAGEAIRAQSPEDVTVLVVLEGSVAIDGQNASARDAFRIEGAVTPRAASNTHAALIRITPIRPSGRGIEAP